ncbi:MAG: hypothetical protein HY360_09785 [Verrucomicrobia bacterium]|nr:hypothetical protein [Verrucomicrobiota bacterium]
MTPKERITVALRGGRPDRVPVTLGLSEMVPVRYCTDDYVRFHWVEKIPLWKARVEIEHDRFGADGKCRSGRGEARLPHEIRGKPARVRRGWPEIRPVLIRTAPVPMRDGCVQIVVPAGSWKMIVLE